MRITIFFGSYRKYWKNISLQLLHNVRRCWIEDKSKMLHFHFTIYLEGIEKLWRHVDLSIWCLESSLQRIETIFHDRLTRKSSIIFFLFFFLFRSYSTTFKPFPRIYFRLVNVELAERCLVYSLLMANTDLPRWNISTIMLTH